MNEIFHYCGIFGIRKNPEYLYRLPNVLLKQKTREKRSTSSLSLHCINKFRLFYNWPIKWASNFLRNHAMWWLPFSYCSGDEVVSWPLCTTFNGYILLSTLYKTFSFTWLWFCKSPRLSCNQAFTDWRLGLNSFF